jgi:hypothetical protein
VAAPLEALSTAVAVWFATGCVAAATRVEATSTESATAARAWWTRAAGRPGEAAVRTGDDSVVRTTGAVACWTAVTGAGTPATGPFACAGPANQTESTQATATSAKMLPRHGQARLACINI